MTMDRTPRVDRRLFGLFDELADARTPDYLEAAIERASSRPQRPAWTFPGRWLPMEITTSRVATPGVPWRMIGAVALIAMLIATAVAVYVGTRPRLPSPFGVAGNGQVIYADRGDIFVRDSLTAAERPLLGGTSADREPLLSPDGTRFVFIRHEDASDYLMAATVDGSAVSRIHAAPLRAQSMAWSPDSRSLALVNDDAGTMRLVVAHADGTPETAIDLGDIVPSQAAWRPPDGRELLVRGTGPDGLVGLYIVPVAGGTPRALLPGRAAGPFGWGQFDGAAWSPDGARIAVTVIDVYTSILRTAVLDAEGSNYTEITNGLPPEAQEGWPAFSPDGSLLAVHRWRWEDDGWLAVYPLTSPNWANHDVGPVIAANGGNVDLIKIWSPDGSRIIARTSNTEQIFSIDPVTGTYDTMGWHATSLPTWQRLAPD